MEPVCGSDLVFAFVLLRCPAPHREQRVHLQGSSTACRDAYQGGPFSGHFQSPFAELADSSERAGYCVQLENCAVPACFVPL